MAKAIILHNYSQSERKKTALAWVLEDPESRQRTGDFTQVAVWLRHGFDVMIESNVFDGFEIEIQDKKEVTE